MLPATVIRSNVRSTLEAGVARCGPAFARLRKMRVDRRDDGRCFRPHAAFAARPYIFALRRLNELSAHKVLGMGWSRRRYRWFASRFVLPFIALATELQPERTQSVGTGLSLSGGNPLRHHLHPVRQGVAARFRLVVHLVDAVAVCFCCARSEAYTSATTEELTYE